MSLIENVRRRASQSTGPSRRWHVCRIEAVEPRQLLSANPLINAGASYVEFSTGDDSAANQMEITFNGGAAGTQLTDVVIDLDKQGDGLTAGDCFFDTQAGGLGVYAAHPLQIVSQTGIDSVSWDVADGGTKLTFHFQGFDAGEKLVFTIDVDEMGSDGSASSLAEGREIEGSKFTTTFTAPHYSTAVMTDSFVDRYDDKLAGKGLDLPPDNYMPPSPTAQSDHTAGAAMSITQTPLPSSLSGTVYEDYNADNLRESGEPGIAGVKLTLTELVDGSYVSTGRTTYTDANGHYSFDNLLPGTYSVSEEQPLAYLSVGATAGTVDGVTRGAVDNVNLIKDVSLLGGEDSVHNDFAEVRPASISGQVYADYNTNNVYDAGDTLLANVTLQLRDSQGSVVATTWTDDQGAYSFTGLMPGTYSVHEVQPSDYFDGPDFVGSLGGALDPTDSITAIPVQSGDAGVHYDFSEIPPATLCGYVYADLNNNGVMDSGETGIGGVTVQLLAADGTPTGQTALTDAAGHYCFTQLTAGTYGVAEVQPADYLDGLDAAGTAGGVAHNPGDLIDGVVLTAGMHGQQYNFGEIVPASISGYVFQDGPTIQYPSDQSPPSVYSVRDGQLKAGDKMLAGVKLQLGDATGAPVLNDAGKPIYTYTDANGYYEFKNLAPGTYTVIEVQPTNYVDGIDTAGTTGGLAINQNTVIDASVLSTLSIDPKYDAILQIKVAAGQTSTHNNFSEVVLQAVPPETPPPILPPDTPPPPLATPLPPGGYPAQFTAVGYPVFIPTPGPGLFGGAAGGGAIDQPAWHLSVIDGGQPRRSEANLEVASVRADAVFDPISWSGADMAQAQWIVANVHGKVIQQFVFGPADAIPVPGDFNGDGKAEAAVYVGGHWFVDLNGDDVWDDGDLWMQLGTSTDQPVVGDWDGDGKADIGIFGSMWTGDRAAIAAEPGLPDARNAFLGRPKNVPPDAQQATNGVRTMKRTAQGPVRADLIDHVFQFGQHGDRAVVGDFNGDGVKTIGVFRDGKWSLDADGDGRWSPADVFAEFGQAGDVPVVGDWTGDGVSKLGVFRHGKFILDTNNNHRLDADDAVIDLGVDGKPAVADFDGDGVDDVAVYQDHAAPKMTRR